MEFPVTLTREKVNDARKSISEAQINYSSQEASKFF